MSRLILGSIQYEARVRRVLYEECFRVREIKEYEKIFLSLEVYSLENDDKPNVKVKFKFLAQVDRMVEEITNI